MSENPNPPRPKLRCNQKLPDGQPLRYNMGPEFTWNGSIPERYYPKTAMNTETNRIELVITAEQDTAIKETLNNLRTQVTEILTQSLTKEQRQRLFKLGPERLAFDAKNDEVMHQRPDLKAPMVDLVAYDKDGAALKTVSAWDTLLAGIAQRITDTLILLGADRMQADLSNYHYIEFLAHQGTAGAPEIYSTLQELYPSRHTASPQPPPATPPSA